MVNENEWMKCGFNFFYGKTFKKSQNEIFRAFNERCNMHKVKFYIWAQIMIHTYLPQKK